MRWRSTPFRRLGVRGRNRHRAVSVEFRVGLPLRSDHPRGERLALLGGRGARTAGRLDAHVRAGGADPSRNRPGAAAGAAPGELVGGGGDAGRLRPGRAAAGGVGRRGDRAAPSGPCGGIRRPRRVPGSGAQDAPEPRVQPGRPRGGCGGGSLSSKSDSSVSSASASASASDAAEPLARGAGAAGPGAAGRRVPGGGGLAMVVLLGGHGAVAPRCCRRLVRRLPPADLHLPCPQPSCPQPPCP